VSVAGRSQSSKVCIYCSSSDQVARKPSTTQETSYDKLILIKPTLESKFLEKQEEKKKRDMGSARQETSTEAQV
jgi:hypothetical protein